MRVAIYGDVHLTKNMRHLQDHWNDSVKKLFYQLYDKFDTLNVESAICLGDFFDKSVLEARSVNLINDILYVLNSRTYPTYLLLGNHEIDSNERNILEFLSEYENIIPVTQKLLVDDQLLFLPYNQSIEDVKDELSGKYVFTHHDIYGSALAGGKVKASFGIDPNLFNNTKRTYNGHVHLPSNVGKVINVGSITKSQHGELKYLENPQYCILDTRTGDELFLSVSENFIAYQDVSVEQLKRVVDHYDSSVKLVLRVSYDYDEEIQEIENYRNYPQVLRLSLRKRLNDTLDSQESKVQRRTLDIKEVITSYINKDVTLEASQKERLIDLSLTMIGGSV